MNLSELSSQEADLYLRIVSVESRRARNGTQLLSLKLADASSGLPATMFDDHPDYEATKELAPGEVVKVRCSQGQFQGNRQLEVSRIRPLDERDQDRWSEAAVFGNEFGAVRDLTVERLVMDIETAPLNDVRGLPPTLVEEVTRVAKDREWPIEKVLALNPLFSRVVSIAVGDATGSGGTVLLAPEHADLDALASDSPDWLRPMSEEQMLGGFWAMAGAARLVITFNGRNFDLPFLRNRSAVLNVPVKTDLLSQPPYQHAPHLDLYQILAGGHGSWGARPMSLDAACFAFGIESPKGVMDGSMVGQAFKEKRYLEIAKYNLADVEATRQLFLRLRDNVLEYLT
ncbi:MAG: ribonuclease H-like domain-containing protein [Planctomycetota bacterium]|nr:ribonuclease H-like domain-containing protein [Planctomycetota bacterium]